MRDKPVAGPVVLVMITTALVVSLHRLGDVTGLSIDWSNPIVWADTTTAEEIVGGCARQLGLVIGYWVLLTVVVSVLSHGPHRPRWVALVTLPAVRRVVDRDRAIVPDVHGSFPHFRAGSLPAGFPAGRPFGRS